MDASLTTSFRKHFPNTILKNGDCSIAVGPEQDPRLASGRGRSDGVPFFVVTPFFNFLGDEGNLSFVYTNYFPLSRNSFKLEVLYRAMYGKNMQLPFKLFVKS